MVCQQPLANVIIDHFLRQDTARTHCTDKKELQNQLKIVRCILELKGFSKKANFFFLKKKIDLKNLQIFFNSCYSPDTHGFPQKYH